MAEAKKGLVTRDKKVAFMAVAGATDGTYTRMTKFTEMSKSSNANEYSRKYVDQPGEDSDVTGYSPSYSYAFDQYVGNAVHDDIVKITDKHQICHLFDDIQWICQTACPENFPQTIDFTL